MISIPVPRESIDDLTKGAAARRSELAESYLSGAAVEALLGIDATALKGGATGVLAGSRDPLVTPIWSLDSSYSQWLPSLS